MSTSTPTPGSLYSVRSISMPTRSHPNFPEIEARMKQLKNWESTASNPKAGTICDGLARLEDVYRCVEELLCLPLTGQSLVHYQNEKWADDVLDGSVRLLDVCGCGRDFLSEMKENAQDLQSALRRRGDKSCKEEKVGTFLCFRKKMKKSVHKSIGELKNMDLKLGTSLSDQDEHAKMVTEVLRDVRAVTVSVLQCFLQFIMSEPKTNKWSKVSKFLHKGQVAASVEEHEEMGEVECVDITLSSLPKHFPSKDSAEVAKVNTAQIELEMLVSCIEEVDVGLENISRCLIQTRVTLLNIFTN